jgi:hypothetical protein
LRAGVVGRVDGVRCVVLRIVRFEPRNIPDDFEILVFGFGRFAGNGLQDEASGVGDERAIVASDALFGDEVDEASKEGSDVIGIIEIGSVGEELVADLARFVFCLLDEQTVVHKAQAGGVVEKAVRASVTASGSEMAAVLFGELG